MTFGNYVLFNLLVAILVEGFSNEVNFLKPRLIMKIENILMMFLFSIQDEPKKPLAERIIEDAENAVAEERETMSARVSRRSFRRANSRQSIATSKNSRQSFERREKKAHFMEKSN